MAKKKVLIWKWAIPMFITCMALIGSGIRIGFKDNLGSILLGLIGILGMIFTLKSFYNVKVLETEIR